MRTIRLSNWKQPSSRLEGYIDVCLYETKTKKKNILNRVKSLPVSSVDDENDKLRLINYNSVFIFWGNANLNLNISSRWNENNINKKNKKKKK